MGDVSLLSLKGPPDNLARSLFVGHDRLFTTNWNVQFYAPIRSVFVQTVQGTHELVGSQTMWTIVCQDKSCSPVVESENTNGRELRVVEPEIKRAFVVTDDGTSAWGVLENPIIRVEDGFTHWPSLPPPTEVRHIPRASRMKRRWIFGGFLLISWLLFSFLRSFYTRRLRFFYSSPIVSQDLTRIQLLDVEKEMSGLLAVPAVASLDRIRDAAMQGGFIHLSCHTLKDQFVLENRGVSVFVSSEQMVAALDGACFVFLAGCDTWTTAQKLKSVSFAVGTVGVVKDKDIRLFAQCFYKELYAHQSIENSFRRAQLLAGCDASAFQLHIGGDQPCCGSTMKRLGNILTLGICQRLVPRLRPTDTRPHLDFGMDDVVGREKEMVAVAKLFAVNERRITVIEGYSAFRFVKQFVSYFSLPGRLFPRVIFLRSSIPPIDKAYDLIVLEPQVEPHVVNWIVENWPPWERCHLLTTGAVLPSLQDASIECKVCRYKLEALQPQRSVELFLRRVHRPLCDDDFKIEHESLSERLLTHPIVGPVLQRGDPDAVIRLAQQVSTSLPSLYDLRDECTRTL